MKKIISCLAIAIMLFACSKEESPTPSDQGSTLERKGGPSPVTTDPVSYILPFGATSGGSISQNSVTERGLCYSTSPNPTVADQKAVSGAGSGTFTAILSGLASNTKYYVRAYGTTLKTSRNRPSVETTAYGNEVSFTTADPDFGTVTDIDGNTYTTVKIGTQVWMVQNLKTTRYRDGISIPEVTDDVSWMGLSSGAYCNYDNDASNASTYGRLYNWYAVTDAHNIAPTGFHVPTKAEMKTLVDYVGGASVAGGKLKEADNAHWATAPWAGPSANGNNSSGLTALPGGQRFIGASSTIFDQQTVRGNLWTATASSSSNAEYIYLQSSTAAVMGSIGGAAPIGSEFDKRSGYSVRCVKD